MADPRRAPAPVTDPRDREAARRRTAVVHGLGAVLLAATTAAVGAMALDAGLDLPVWVRSILLAGWLVLGGGLVWWWVVLPLRGQAPARPGAGAAARAAFAAVALLVPLLFAPGATERVLRFAVPWTSTPTGPAYRVVLSSGDVVVKRGEPVTLSAYLERTRPGVSLPDTALLVRASGGQGPVAMTHDGAAAFRITLPEVAGDFDYFVEVGGVRSDPGKVRVGTPVRLVEGTALTVRPPAYAEGVIPERVQAGFDDCDVLPYSRLGVTLRLSHPPSDARLEWRPAGGSSGPEPAPLLRFEPDRLAAVAELPVTDSGTLVLSIVGDRGVREEHVAVVRTTPDLAPRFEKVVGMSTAALEARPDDRLPIEVAVRDDVRVVRLGVEYRVVGREADVRTEPARLPGLGTAHVEGVLLFNLTGKVREGDTLQFRLRAADDRFLPARKLSPQETTYPAAAWATLRVTATARPIVEQEVFGQRDSNRTRLEESRRSLAEGSALLAQVRAAREEGTLPVHHQVRLRTAREKVQRAADLLAEMARDAGLTPDLRPLGLAARGLIEGPLRDTVRTLEKTEHEPDRAARERHLEDAAAAVARAGSGLTDLAGQNERTAAGRLVQHRLRLLAADQGTLAEQALDPKPPVEDLRREQRNLAARLDALLTGDDLLKSAVRASIAAEIQALAAQTAQLTEEQAALAAAGSETEARARRLHLEPLLRRQQELADNAGELASRTATAVRLAGLSPLSVEPLKAAAGHLQGDRPDAAIIEQEKAARELERAAAGLAAAADARSDLNHAARELARWQEDLKRRLSDALKAAPGGRLPAAVRTDLLDEQQSIADVFRLLPTTSGDPGSGKAEAAVRKALTEAVAAFRDPKADAAGAAARSADALARFAALAPTREARLARAKAGLERLKREQDSLAREAEEAVRASARDPRGEQLDAAAQKQRALAERLQTLDLPGFEPRRAVAVRALTRAAQDLRSGAMGDVAISQQDARRVLDRLLDAVGDTTPADDRVQVAARLQREVAEDARAKEDPGRLLSRQQEVVRTLAGVSAPEAAVRLAEAREAALEVERALLRRPRSDAEVRDRARHAAEILARLASALTGSESDLERVERLAREREALVAPARAAAKQASRPEETAEAVRRCELQLEELAAVRVGRAVEARTAAVEALRRLRQSGNPERQPALQQAAAEALRKLADELHRAGDRSVALDTVGPPGPADDDLLRQMDGGGRLPSAQDAAAVRRLADRQRELLQRTSEVVATLARGVRPAAHDPLGTLAREQLDLALAVRDLADGIDLAAEVREPWRMMEELFLTAADHLTEGRSGAALAATTEAARQLGSLAPMLPASGSQRWARRLEDRQRGLIIVLATFTDPAVEAARQNARQTELAEQLAGVENALGRTVAVCAAFAPRAAEPLGRALAEAKSIREGMERSVRDVVAGRSVGTARRAASQRLPRVSREINAALEQMDSGTDGSLRAVGDAVRSASVAMAAVEARAEPDRIRESMLHAAELLIRASGQLNHQLR